MLGLTTRMVGLSMLDLPAVRREPCSTDGGQVPWNDPSYLKTRREASTTSDQARLIPLTHGVDAVAVALQVFQALQYLVIRENDPFPPFVITIGALHAGTVANVIPNEA